MINSKADREDESSVVEDEEAMIAVKFLEMTAN